MQRIAIHSVPRSGSTWLGEIFNSHPGVIYKYQPLFSYAFKGRLNEHSTYEDIVRFYEEIAQSKDDFINQTQARQEGKLPVFRKDENPVAVAYKEVRYHYILENLLQRDPSIKVVGLVRNPMAVIYSWLTAPKEFRKDLGWNAMEEWRYAPKKNLNKAEEYNGFEKWKEVTRMFLRLQKEYPDNFMLIRYDKLMKDTEDTVIGMFDFCHLSFHENTKNFLLESQQKNNPDKYSVFKKKDRDDEWKDKLDQKIIKEIEKDLKDSELSVFLT